MREFAGPALILLAAALASPAAAQIVPVTRRATRFGPIR